MPSRLLKVKASIPFNLEHRLINHWGFTVATRVHGDYLMLKKNYISDKVAADAGVQRTIRASVNKPTTVTENTKIVYPEFGNKWPKLTAYQRKALEKRCDNIVHLFPDPFSVPESVRARLTAIMQQYTADECEFIQEYMDENFPVSLKEVVV